MQLIRVGYQVINLDLVREVRFAEKGAPGKAPDGRDAPISRDCMFLEMSDGRQKYVYGLDAVAAWGVIKRLCAYGETDPPAGPGDDAGGPHPDLDAARRRAWALCALLEGRTVNPDMEARAAARELAGRLDGLCAGAT